MNDTQKSLALLVGIVALIILCPFGVLWALNAIGLAVPYTFEAWLGAFVLSFVFGKPAAARVAK